jgi:signal transduction histidine kinase
VDVVPTPPPLPTPAQAPTKPILLRDYWPRFNRTAMLITVVMQLAVAVVVGMSLLTAGLHTNEAGFWIIILATFLTATGLNILLVHELLRPHLDLVNAITSAAGEEPNGPLATPNSVSYQRNGFKPVLQFVYELVADKNKPSATASPANADTERLAAALDHTKAGLIVLDADGNVQYANRRAPIVKDVNDVPQLELLFEKDNEFSEWLEKCRETAVHDERVWLRVPNRLVGDEDRRIFDITASYEKGSAAEVVLVLFDNTGTYKPEDDELDFISFAAHELRGPITVIRGYLDVLDIELDQVLAADQKELMKRLIVSANRLSGHINNILNTSKYDRRHLQVHLAEEQLSDIYDTIRDDMALRASSQNRLLSVTLPDDLPTIAADRSSLSEVISNLIDNALKYSNEGGAVAVSAIQKDANFIEVRIQDNGIGMPSNVVGNLFHKFYRSHRSRETVAGTGIGLYICKAIVESHGGTIGVSSVEGQGSVFSFTVPIYASVASKLQANDHTNAGLIKSSDGWIKNHSRFSS